MTRSIDVHIYSIIGLLSLGTAALAGNSQQEATYSITKYDIAIVPDFRSRVLSLEAEVDISNPNLLDSFDFGLNSRYSSIVVEADSAPASFQREDDWITVRLAHPTTAVRMKFRLRGMPGRSIDENRAVIEDSSLFLLWSDRFYPIDFDHWAPVRTSVSLPAGFDVIAPGRLVSSASNGGNVLHVFETLRPTVTFSVFADCRWRRSDRELNGIKMRTLLYPGSERFADQIFSSSADVLKFYSDVLSPYPFDEFTFVEIDSIYARRAFPGFIGYSPRYLEKEFTTTGYDAHETALLWWDYTTRGTGEGSYQWTEGFGDYSEVMYTIGKQTPLARTFREFREAYLRIPSESDLLYGELKGNTRQELIHGKYPWLMHILRYVVGERAFRSGLRLLFERYQHATFTMDEFILTLEEGTGQSLRWWREEWLERRGVPDITAAASCLKAGSGYRLTCTLTQKGNIYHIPLEIEINTGAGKRIETVHLSHETETFTFSIAGPPATISLDPAGWILMRPHPPVEIR